jgi:hypothetical protein
MVVVPPVEMLGRVPPLFVFPVVPACAVTLPPLPWLLALVSTFPPHALAMITGEITRRMRFLSPLRKCTMTSE